jgi:hypothetical protein
MKKAKSLVKKLLPPSTLRKIQEKRRQKHKNKLFPPHLKSNKIHPEMVAVSLLQILCKADNPR